MQKRHLISVSLATTALFLASLHSSYTTANAEDLISLSEKPNISTENILPSEGIPKTLLPAVQSLSDSADFALTNGLSWDDKLKILHVHYVGALGKLGGVVSSYLPIGSFDFVQDPLSNGVLVAAEKPLLDAATHAGLQVGAIFPEADNSGLWVRIVIPDLPSGSIPPESLAIKSVESLISVPIRWETMKSTPADTSRLSDTAPFWGAAAIHHTYSGGTTEELCTAGFAVKNGSTTAMLTASHCGTDGHSWTAGYTIGQGAAFGTFNTVYTGGADIAMISGKTYGGVVWLGEVGDTTSQNVKGRYSPVVGDAVCYDGARSGQRCGNSITNSNGIVCPEGTCYNNEVDTVSGSHSGVIQGGDSGSPVL